MAFTGSADRECGLEGEIDMAQRLKGAANSVRTEPGIRARYVTKSTARVATPGSGPDFKHETAWMVLGHAPVAGIDEAGRGPWAGPVVAAAVVLDRARLPQGIDDSKVLKRSERERLYDEIMASAQVGVGIAGVDRIDRDNILRATLWAMGVALAGLSRVPAAALVDGNIAPELPCAVETLVAGDARSLSIAAASIIAKVTRDRLMIALAHDHPGYGWEHNKGYGVPAHRDGIARLGLTPHHRRSFRPIASRVDRSGIDSPSLVDPHCGMPAQPAQKIHPMSARDRPRAPEDAGDG